MLNRSQGMSEITYAERFEDAIDKAAGETHSIYLSIEIPTLEVERKKRTFGPLGPNQVKSIEQALPASSLGNYVGKSGYLKRFS